MLTAASLQFESTAVASTCANFINCKKWLTLLSATPSRLLPSQISLFLMYTGRLRNWVYSPYWKARGSKKATLYIFSVRPEQGYSSEESTSLTELARSPRGVAKAFPQPSASHHSSSPSTLLEAVSYPTRRQAPAPVALPPSSRSPVE